MFMMNEKVERMATNTTWLRHNYPDKEPENPQFIYIWEKVKKGKVKDDLNPKTIPFSNT